MVRNINKWAYDLSQDCLRYGEVNDVDVINQSIQTILGTYYGERLDNIQFGCGLPLYIFSIMESGNVEAVKKEVVSALKRWEDRIIVNESGINVILDYNKNSIIISIPYTIKITGQQTTYISRLSGGGL